MEEQYTTQLSDMETVLTRSRDYREIHEEHES